MQAPANNGFNFAASVNPFGNSSVSFPPAVPGQGTPAKPEGFNMSFAGQPSQPQQGGGLFGASFGGQPSNPFGQSSQPPSTANSFSFGQNNNIRRRAQRTHSRIRTLRRNNHRASIFDQLRPLEATHLTSAHLKRNLRSLNRLQASALEARRRRKPRTASARLKLRQLHQHQTCLEDSMYKRKSQPKTHSASTTRRKLGLQPDLNSVVLSQVHARHRHFSSELKLQLLRRNQKPTHSSLARPRAHRLRRNQRLLSTLARLSKLQELQLGRQPTTFLETMEEARPLDRTSLETHSRTLLQHQTFSVRRHKRTRHQACSAHRPRLASQLLHSTLDRALQLQLLRQLTIFLAAQSQPIHLAI